MGRSLAWTLRTTPGRVSLRARPPFGSAASTATRRLQSSPTRTWSTATRSRSPTTARGRSSSAGSRTHLQRSCGTTWRSSESWRSSTPRSGTRTGSRAGTPSRASSARRMLTECSRSRSTRSTAGRAPSTRPRRGPWSCPKARSALRSGASVAAARRMTGGAPEWACAARPGRAVCRLLPATSTRTAWERNLAWATSLQATAHSLGEGCLLIRIMATHRLRTAPRRRVLHRRPWATVRRRPAMGTRQATVIRPATGRRRRAGCRQEGAPLGQVRPTVMTWARLLTGHHRRLAPTDHCRQAALRLQVTAKGTTGRRTQHDHLRRLPALPP
mmetsp:Transcript_70668/g.218151  ORF Transcript_70668/g.218151 Transcript_70668/m.218151 type:complete len:329 (-) Transcript_70668:40-1026(-)